MHRATQVELIRRLLDHHRAGTTQLAPAAYRNPVSDYTSAEQLEQERRALFLDRPVAVGLSADLPSPGDYLCVEVVGVPLLLLRGADRRVRAFANACRHRGSPLVQGRGHVGGRLVCPFHAWSYTLDGQLAARPRAEEAFAQIAAQDSGLLELPSAESVGVVLVRPGGGAEIDPDTALGEVADDLAAFDLARYRYFDARVTRWRCNWKLILDTFLESYHVPALHRQSVARWYLDHPMTFDAFGPHLRFPVVRRSLLELRDKPESECTLLPHATIQYLLGPATLLAYTIDHLVVWRVWPLAVDQSEVHVSLYTPEPVDREDVRRHYERTFELHLSVSGNEDFAQQERVQRVLHSGALEETLLGRNEVAVIHFHRSIREAIGLDSPT